MKNDAIDIMNYAFRKANPYDAVKNFLSSYNKENVTVISAGKAAVPMARAAFDCLDNKIRKGIVLTKYNHLEPLNPIFDTFEAGHPVPDDNSLIGTDAIIKECVSLGENDEILFLLSGGASALFESPVIPLSELQSITDYLLKCSADITEVNTVRKRLSRVKGGKFAKLCKCHITNVILSDVIGNRIESVASGPCCEDTSNSSDVEKIISKYNIPVSESVKGYLLNDPPKNIDNVDIAVVGDINILCQSAKEKAEELGYKSEVVSAELTGEARICSENICKKALKTSKDNSEKLALIYGGETTVTVLGNGLGGRNQEMALVAAEHIAGNDNIVFLSAGSDGTDGPTDAAGGIVDGNTKAILSQKGIEIQDVINNSDSYHGLKAADALIITGATGTNVNDLTLVLVHN